MDKPKELTDELVTQLAEEAEVHKLTVMRAYVGLPVRGKTGLRVRRVLAANGFLAPVAVEEAK